MSALASAAMTLRCRRMAEDSGGLVGGARREQWLPWLGWHLIPRCGGWAPRVSGPFARQSEAENDGALASVGG